MRNLIGYCLSDACRHQAIIDVSSYPGARNKRIDVRPNWKEASGSLDDWSGRPAMPGSDDAAVYRAVLPTISRSVPTRPQWAYEIKHDGFPFLAVHHRKQVRVYSRGGHDWSKQLPAITEALEALPMRSVVLDGEGVICAPHGRSEFDRMRACFIRQGAPEAFHLDRHSSNGGPVGECVAL